jgi:hypothetical protein
MFIKLIKHLLHMMHMILKLGWKSNIINVAIGKDKDI